MTHVTILLPTYNGAAHLDEQITSIINQTYTDWTLMIRDDGSSDGTVALVQGYCDRYPNIVLIDPDDRRNLGVKRSVHRLLESATSDYVMLCDQDDVWLPTKVEMAVHRAEQESPDVPLLVYTDLRVVDGELRTIKPAMHGGSGRTAFGELLIENTVTGCTALLNRSLRDLLVARESFADPDMVMHDWWVALVASAFGKVFYLSQPSILYRQHGTNTVGAPGKIDGLRRLLSLEANIESIKAPLRQARLLERDYGAQLAGDKSATLRAWVTLPELPLLGRLRVIRRGTFATNSWVRTANLAVLLILFPGRLRTPVRDDQARPRA